MDNRKSPVLSCPECGEIHVSSYSDGRPKTNGEVLFCLQTQKTLHTLELNELRGYLKNHPKIDGKPIYVGQRLYYAINDEVIWLDVEFWNPPSDDYKDWHINGRNQHEEFTSEFLLAFSLTREDAEAKLRPADESSSGQKGDNNVN